MGVVDKQWINSKKYTIKLTLMASDPSGCRYVNCYPFRHGVGHESETNFDVIMEAKRTYQLSLDSTVISTVLTLYILIMTPIDTYQDGYLTDQAGRPYITAI